MKVGPGITRRGFWGGSALLVGAAIGVWGCREPAVREAAGRLAAAVDDRKEWSDLGRAYLEGASDAPGLGELVALLEDALGPGEPADLLDRLAKRASRDFEEGRTVRVEGWILSESEVWLAALVARIDG
jgi:hypothetical protein